MFLQNMGWRTGVANQSEGWEKGGWTPADPWEP